MQDVRRTANMHHSKESVRLHNLSYGEGKMKALKTEVLDIICRLTAAQAPIPIRNIIEYVMAALPPRFEGIENIILPQADTMTLSAFFATLEAKEVTLDDKYKRMKAMKAAEKTVEKRSHQQQKPKKTLAVVSQGEGGRHKSKGPGGSSRPRGDMSKIKCHNCGKVGHFARDCRAPITPQQAEFLKKRAETQGEGSSKRAKVNAASASKKSSE